MRDEQAGGGVAIGDPSGRVKAWDVPTRLFHWSLVILIATSYVTRHYVADLKWHKWSGYAILTLIVFRLLWGLVGSSTARFSSFIYAPWTAACYGRDFLLRRPRHYLGHNPLGGAMVLVMLGLVAAQGLTGLFSYDDHDALDGGPLASRISEPLVAAITKWHIWLFDVILIVVAMHILANLAYIFWKRENLVKPMITGWKAPDAFEDQAEASIAPAGRALLCVLVAVGIVLGGITLAGGRVF